MFNPVRVGKRTRYSYARIKEVMQMPHLLDIQRNSYNWFLHEGLAEILKDISPITDFTGNLELFFKDFSLGEPKYSLDECKERDVTYAAPIRVNVQLVNHELGDEVKEQEVFMGDFPLMTSTGTFIINGAERVIVSQLVRSPGAYFSKSIDSAGKMLFNSTLIPNRGAWIELEMDSTDSIAVRIDRTRKMPVIYLLRALGFELDHQILDLFDFDPRIAAQLHQATDGSSRDSALVEIYRRLRPGEPATVENSFQLLNSMFFDPKRYDLATVGRFKITQKLGWKARLKGKRLAQPLIDKSTGEVLIPADVLVTEDMLSAIDSEREAEIFDLVPDEIHRGFITPIKLRIRKENSTAHPNSAAISARNSTIGQDDLPESAENAFDPDVITMLCAPTLSIHDNRTVCVADVISAISYVLNLIDGIGGVDDIDHLGNRRVRSVGELLQNQYRIGLARMERVVRERMTIQASEIITPQLLINIRPVVAAIKEFFGSSQLSQFMDQHNPLSELTHKRRLSALGPGGLSRERAGFEVRDVHNSHYGRMCPIETPEGPNIGLIGSLSNYARVNQFGFIETPYRKVDKFNHRVTSEVQYLTADQEEHLAIAQANEPLDENDWFVNERVTARFNEETTLVRRDKIDFMDVSPKQVVSIATALIPFLENDDANRALMGANMQRQAVPLLKTQAPLVGTGMEYKAACDSGVMVLARRSGTVVSLAADYIRIRVDDENSASSQHDNAYIAPEEYGYSNSLSSSSLSSHLNQRSQHSKYDHYKLQKFVRSNQGTCINQVPIVNVGEHVEANQPIADGPATDEGELALGYNVIVAYMPWEGYNYEDAILLSENLIKNDIYTSIHIEEYECEARDTKLGSEEITRDIPNVGEDSLKDLDSRGIVAIGADVRPGDILVGKVTPKGETELTAEERLLRAIFGEKAREVRDTSLRVPHGEAGKIVDIKEFDRESNDELSPGVNRLVRVYIAQKRKISVGDKMSGRHGNKGVVSRIMREEDMPFMPDGRAVDVVLNPLGVPSRMNIGQVMEAHLGMAVRGLGDVHVAVPVFDGATNADMMETMKRAGMDPNGKTTLYDGRTGEPFENPVTVGCVYMLKLHHLVDDKIHARSTGPYSLVTQQPLGGKAQFGGQRFGEMEVWALEAYGASYTLQEILTVKSDDVVGRVKAYEAIVKGENIPEPGVPESFKVLIKELQSIGLDIKVLSEGAREIMIEEEEEAESESTIQARAEELGFETIEDTLEGGEEEPGYEPYEEDWAAEEIENESKVEHVDNAEDEDEDDVELPELTDEEIIAEMGKIGDIEEDDDVDLNLNLDMDEDELGGVNDDSEIERLRMRRMVDEEE